MDTDADQNGNDAAAACCGLFSVTALPADTRLLIGHHAEATAVFFSLESQTAGQGPGRINRPPIG